MIRSIDRDFDSRGLESALTAEPKTRVIILVLPNRQVDVGYAGLSPRKIAEPQGPPSQIHITSGRAWMSRVLRRKPPNSGTTDE